jgi:hypothetical protein
MVADVMRPFFSYFGGKWTLAPRYPPPEHDTIVEPFAGSAGYATRYPDREVVLVERAPHIAALWRWLISVSVDEVLALPLDVGELAGLPDGAQTLIKLWTQRGGVCPRRPTRSKWMSSGRWPSSFWGQYARARVAAQVPNIRHWRLIEGDYQTAPDTMATWFIDPPYVGAKHYRARVDNYADLGAWSLSRSGLVIVCEQEGADWLPFEPFREAKSIARGTYREVVYVQGRRDLFGSPVARSVAAQLESKEKVA